MIYTTFKQWVKGRFLETGEPRKQAYSKDELALIEMGWGYGYDAGVEWQKSQTALDKKAENARELGLDYEPLEAKHEPEYYGLTKDHLWMSISKEHYDRLKPEFRMACYTTPPQRTWIELTNQELADCWDTIPERAMRRVEAKLKEKNT
jgi:hypothetical protein